MRKTAARVFMWLLVLVAAQAAATVAAAPAAAAIGAAAPSIGASLAAVQGSPRPRDLLAESADDHFWVARVTKQAPDNSTQTQVMFRARWSSGNSDWTALPVIPDRVESMATSNGELLLVLASGQWEIADDTEIRSGPSDPMWDSMLAIGSGQEAVWAVVQGVGPSTQLSAGGNIGTSTAASAGAVNAATEPATQPGEAEAESRLMVCQFEDGKWTKAEAIPDGVSDDPAAMSLAVVKGLPVLAWRTMGGKLCVSRMSAEGAWSRSVVVKVPAGAAFDFKLLTINDRAVLWVAVAPAATRPSAEAVSAGGSNISGASEVMIGDAFSQPIPLIAQGKMPANITSQTLVAAFGNLRWLAYAGDQQIEQDYSLDGFPQSFPPAKMNVVASPRPAVIPLTPWIGGDAILILLAGLLAMRQRSQLGNQGDPSSAESKRDRQQESKPGLGPLGVRFVAGMVDLAPVLGVVAIVHPASTGNPLAGIDTQSLQQLLWLSLAAYVLHTLIAELVCGQSIGKMIFGLRVMGADGNLPKPGAIVMRNLLRVVDVILVLPLLVVLLTPMQQRVGDVVAGTVVVSTNEEDEGNGDDGGGSGGRGGGRE